MRDNKLIVFRAYLEGIIDNITPTWNEDIYVGRSEPVYTYQYALREISFTLKLMANNRYELMQIYRKMNRLTSMCYPEYKEDVILSAEDSAADKTVRMKPPLIQLRLGDLFGTDTKMLTGFLAGLTYNVPENSTWEHDSSMVVPKHVMATIMYKVIHDETPSLRFAQSTGKTGINFYGINELIGNE